jgi:hypothetical protein
MTLHELQISNRPIVHSGCGRIDLLLKITSRGNSVPAMTKQTDDEEAVHGKADHCCSKGARSWNEDERLGQQARHLGSQALKRESQVRRYGRVRRDAYLGLGR